MKINSRLKRSRHGVYYFRIIIPKDLRSQLNNKSEIKRSLGTKEPKKALIYAHALSLKLSSGAPLITVLNNINMVIHSIRLENMAYNSDDLNHFLNSRHWSITYPDGTKVQTDPHDSDEELKFARDVAIEKNAEFSSPMPRKEINFDTNIPWLSNVTESWVQKLKAENLNPKTIDEYDSKFKLFLATVGDRPVDSISSAKVSDFITRLSTGQITGKMLSHETVNKYLAAMNSYFQHCQRLGHLPNDKPLPTENNRLGKNKKNVPKSRPPFSSNDLEKLFSIEVAKEYNSPHKYWVPLIALFTGARIEEICQLSINDIYQDEDKVWVLDINENENWKSLKTPAAERTVPLHKELLSLGLLKYLETVRTHFPKEERLFPYLTSDNYLKFSGSVSKWFSRHLKKLDIKTAQIIFAPKVKEKSFHSFRGTFNDLLKTQNLHEETRCQILGHEYNSVNSKYYSQKHSNQWLLVNVFKTISYPKLDLTLYQYDHSLAQGQVKELLIKRDRELKNKQARNSKKSVPDRTKT